MKLSTVLGAVFLTVSAFEHASANQNNSNLLGWWVWNERGLSLLEFKRARQNKESYSLTFGRNGLVEAMVYMPHGLENGVGEALSNTGRYRIVGRRLIITRENVSAEGWPSRDSNPPYRYSCRITVAPDAASFRLKDCPIDGTWLREGEQ
jgi:hypothetical protein